MIIVPLYAFLIIYGVFLLACAGFFVVNVGNLVRTGTFTFASLLATFLFLSCTAIVVWGTWHTLQAVDWAQPIFNFTYASV
ncbi:MAG: hypothetical protein EXS55_02740 [Candidatus Magasanikbacteria bacterium]|nr:hypothetical protein [Candidatus Magasanikbacteria bacterium]